MTWKLPFDNKKSVVIALLVLFLLFVSYGVFAAEIEVGPTYTGEFNGGTGLVVTERVFDGKIDIGVALMGEQTWEGITVGNNGNVFFAFVAKRPERWWKVLPSEVTFGAAHWIKTDKNLIGSRQGFMLGIKWRFKERYSAGIRHWSNSGVVKPNRGQDFPNLGLVLTGDFY